MHKSAVDYHPYLEAAAREGTIKSKKTGLGVIGASGVGKTSVLNLLLNQPPVLKHCSTPVARPLKGIWMIANCNKWKHEESSDILLKSIADCVWKCMKDRESANGADPTVEQPLPQSPDKRKHELEVQVSQLPSHSSSNSPSVVPSAIQPTAPSVSILDLPATAKVAEILKSSHGYKCLEDMHFVSVTDSGGQAPFIDIAPSLFPYNSINLVVFKLNESLDSDIAFSYSIDGNVVGSEKRKITTEQLILAAVSSKTRVKRPNIRGVVSIDSCEKPHCMALGTHYDVYKRKKNAENLETLGSKNERLEILLKEFEDVLIANGESTIFPLDTLSRDEESQIIAGKIRRLASECFTEVEIPVSWYLFQIAIEEMKVNGKMVIPFETFLDIGKERNMSKNQTTAALQYLHDLNVCLYYPLIVPHVVFTSPQFLFNVISKLMAVSFGERDPRIPLNKATVRRLKNNGIFTKDLVVGCISRDDDCCSADDVLSLMCHLHIAAPIPELDTYFVPCLLQSSLDPVHTLDDLEDFSIQPLVFSWNNTVPHGLFTSLVSRLAQSNGFFLIDRELQYRNKVTLYCRSLACQVVLFEYPTFIGLSSTLSSTDKEKCPKLLENVQEGMKMVLNALHCDAMADIKEPTFLCNIPGCPSSHHHMGVLDSARKFLTCTTKTSLKSELSDAHCVWFGAGKGIHSIK